MASALQKNLAPFELVQLVWFLEVNIQCFGTELEITEGQNFVVRGSYSPFYLTGGCYYNIFPLTEVFFCLSTSDLVLQLWLGGPAG